MFMTTLPVHIYLSSPVCANIFVAYGYLKQLSGRKALDIFDTSTPHAYLFLRSKARHCSFRGSAIRSRLRAQVTKNGAIPRPCRIMSQLQAFGAYMYPFRAFRRRERRRSRSRALVKKTPELTDAGFPNRGFPTTAPLLLVIPALPRENM